MRCKIADLIVEVPEAGGLAPRCQAYLWDGEEGADITIRTDHYRLQRYPAGVPEWLIAYGESGYQFCMNLLLFEGLYLHASAVALDGKAYLFSADCGTGKSTHTRLWQATFGEAAQVFNDDKPALRCIDGTWYAYGTPWCGKDGININRKVPLAGICFLRQAPENKIRRLTMQEAVPNILRQTIRKFQDVETLRKMLGLVDSLVRQIPIFELENRPEPEAVRLSYETMRRAAEEIEL